MTKLIVLIFILPFSAPVAAQDIEVIYDKKRDHSVYKTFSMGGGEIITPSDKRGGESKKLLEWVTQAIEQELIEKGLTKLDSAGDLVATYIVGSVDRSETNYTGPLGGTPGVLDPTRSSVVDILESSLVIDLNDKRNLLIWRVSATSVSNYLQSDRLIQEVVEKGFKKFSLKPPRKKKTH